MPSTSVSLTRDVRLRAARLCAFLLGPAIAASAFAQTQNAAPGHSRQFPPGSVTKIDDLPVSRLRTRLERLSDAARQRALDKLKNFHFPELDLDSLDADEEGGVFYADHFTIDAPPAAAEPGSAEATVPV